MDTERLLDTLERTGASIVSEARPVLGAAVPTCPRWVVADVLGHLGRVYRSVADIVEQRLLEQPSVAPPKPPAGDQVVGFFSDALDHLVTCLRRIPSDEPLYTWSDQGNAAFYQRRMCHETAAHAIDVYLAAGSFAYRDVLDADVAADGVSELYDVVLPFGLTRSAHDLPQGSLHLHRLDGPGEWTLTATDGRLVVGREHARATAAVRGSGVDLFAYVWNRGRGASLEVVGEESVAEAWACLAP